MRRAFRDHNSTLNLDENTPVPAADRARLRTDLARTMVTETEVPPLDVGRVRHNAGLRPRDTA